MKPRLWVAVALMFAAKTFITTLFRGVYPFAPHFAAAMSVSDADFILLLSFGELAGALSPVFGAFSERIGPRRMVIGTTFAAAVFSAACGFGLASMPWFGIFWYLNTLSRTLYMGSMGGFIGTYIPEKLRVHVIAIVELSWGAAGFLGLPFIGIVASVGSMSVILYTMAAFIGLTSVGFAVMLKKFPQLGCGPVASAKFTKIDGDQRDIDTSSPSVVTEGSSGDLFAPEARLHCFIGQSVTVQGDNHEEGTNSAKFPRKSAVQTVLKDPVAVSICISVFLAMYGSALTFGNYAPWLIREHNLSPKELGFASTVIGVAEFVAELVVIAMGNCFDPARSSAVCFLLSTLTAASLIVVEHYSLPVHLTVLAWTYLLTEMEIVFMFAVAARTLPDYQTFLFVCINASLQFGRFSGGVSVAPVWAGGGIVLDGVITTVIQGAGLVFALYVCQATTGQRQTRVSAESASIQGVSEVDPGIVAREGSRLQNTDDVSDFGSGLSRFESTGVVLPVSLSSSSVETFNDN